MKVCPKCEIKKTNKSFHKNRASYDGLSTYCKSCRINSRAGKRYSKEKFSMKVYASSTSGLKAHKKAKQKYRKSIHGSVKRRVWNKGLSPTEQRRALKAFENFDGRCECCGTTKFGPREPHLDHKNGKFRGILCRLCNGAAAFVRDNIRICRQLEKYLRRTN